MNIQDLWDDFAMLPDKKQVEVLKAYTYYVADYDYENGNPVSFLEWWTNDYEVEE